MGHLRLTIGYLKATMTIVHLRVTLGHLKVTIGNFFSELHPKVRPTCLNQHFLPHHSISSTDLLQDLLIVAPKLFQ